MHQTVKKYFIPHAENNYHPHILHTKRAVFYSAFFLSLKLIVFIFVLALPTSVFVLPDILAIEQKKIIAETNEFRAQKNLPLLKDVTLLDASAQNKAEDMAKYSYFSHVSPNKKSVTDWVTASGYTYNVVGENLAMGFSTAEDVMSAWKNSPAHYANLVDTDFADIGVGMQYGTYSDAPTVFVAQHFATPEKVSDTAKIVVISNKEVKKTDVTNSKKTKIAPAVLADKEIAQPSIPLPVITVDNEHSHMFWQEKDGKILLIANANISGAVQSASVVVGKYALDLQPGQNNIYSARLLTNESADQFFRVIIPPSLRIVGTDGVVVESQLPWFNVKVVSPTPFELYIKSKNNLAPITNIFTVSRWVYLAAFVFFGLALLLNIVIEVRKQHPHVIAQTSGLLALLVLLFIM